MARVKKETKIPDTTDTGMNREFEEQAREAAVDFEVLRVWRVNGVLYTELENIRSGKTFRFIEMV